MRKAIIVTLTLTLLAGAWFIFPAPTAAWLNGLMLLMGFAIGDILQGMRNHHA